MTATHLVYVETNLLMAVATGREPRGDELRSAASPSVRVAIPAVCCMEAFSALEDEQGRRRWFKDQLEHQIGQLRRDVTSAHAGILVARLEEGRDLNDNLLDEIQDRLFRFVERAATAFELLPLTPAVLTRSVQEVLIDDPTDNLILTTILDDAARSSIPQKALLTGNTHDFGTPGIKQTLRNAGIALFTAVEHVLGWLSASRSS